MTTPLQCLEVVHPRLAALLLLLLLLNTIFPLCKSAPLFVIFVVS